MNHPVAITVVITGFVAGTVAILQAALSFPAVPFPRRFHFQDHRSQRDSLRLELEASNQPGYPEKRGDIIWDAVDLWDVFHGDSVGNNATYTAMNRIQPVWVWLKNEASLVSFLSMGKWSSTMNQKWKDHVGDITLSGRESKKNGDMAITCHFFGRRSGHFPMPQRGGRKYGIRVHGGWKVAETTISSLLQGRPEQCPKPSVMTLPSYSCRSSHAGLSISLSAILHHSWRFISWFFFPNLMFDAYPSHQQPWDFGTCITAAQLEQQRDWFQLAHLSASFERVADILSGHLSWVRRGQHMSKSESPRMGDISIPQTNFNYTLIGWWFQPLWKILVSWEYYSHIYIYIWVNKTWSKPPTSWWRALLQVGSKPYCYSPTNWGARMLILRLGTRGHVSIIFFYQCFFASYQMNLEIPPISRWFPHHSTPIKSSI